MTETQKFVIVSLSILAIITLTGLGGAIIFFIFLSPAAESGPVPALAQQPVPTPLFTSTPTAVSSSAATAIPTDTPQPSPTGTPVVVETVLPTPTPTPANCLDDIRNFGASGVITDEEVQQYLREAIPGSHLDYCRAIEYVPQPAKLHGTAISGNIIPAYRQIYVYAIEPEFLSVETILDALVHEVGHNVHMNIRRDNFELDVRWAQLHRQSEKMFAANRLGFVSVYAQTDKFEDFAESYRAYVRQPELLRMINPDKHEFMRREIFKGG